MVLVIEAPDDETYAKYVLTLCSEGNLRTITLKAFVASAAVMRGETSEEPR